MASGGSFKDGKTYWDSHYAGYVTSRAPSRTPLTLQTRNRVRRTLPAARPVRPTGSMTTRARRDSSEFDWYQQYDHLAVPLPPPRLALSVFSTSDTTVGSGEWEKAQAV